MSTPVLPPTTCPICHRPVTSHKLSCPVVKNPHTYRL